MSFKSVFVVAALAAASFNAAACYTVYDRSNRVMYRGEQPPVDMSLQLHEALQARFPGGHMVFDQGADCLPVGIAELARPSGPAAPPNTAVMGAGPAKGQVVASAASQRNRSMAGSSPLLTDRRTAVAMNLPYRTLSGDIVVVPAQSAAGVDLPTFNVVPASAPLAAAAPARSGVVITEMHNPPLTVVERGSVALISRR